MNENEYNIENLLADEIHRLDLRIDDFTAMVTALNNRVSNLNNNDINENISNISNIVDRHTTQIESLQSATSDNQTDISKTQDHIDEVSGIVDKQGDEIKSIKDNEQVAQTVVLTKGATRGAGGDYDEEIAELHEEIHEVAEVVDDHTIRIRDLDSSLGILTADFDNKCADLDAEDLSLQTQITEMDVEHHEELHMLGNAIDALIISMESLNNFVGSLPKFVVLSEEEYESLTSLDSSTFYYTYE